ncbi:unnamed protein product [Ectocarpus sp. 8 AP-2014]
MWCGGLVGVLAVLLHVSNVSDGFTTYTVQLRSRKHQRADPDRITTRMLAQRDSSVAAAITRSTAIKQVLGGLGIGIVSTLLEPDASRALESDEFEEVFDDDAIGIELEDVKYKGSSRVLVKRVVPGSAAARRPRIKADLVLVSANGVDLERQSATAAKKIIKTSSRPLTLVLRDNSLFQQLLKPAPPTSPDNEATGVAVTNGGFEPISTKVSPEGNGREEQVVKLLNSDKSAECNSCGQGARRGDLLEIEYTAKLEDGKVFDGSSIKVNGREVVGRAGDTTLFFVLGKQPKGQFPPGWDLLLIGMCVGETRLLSVPPLLGYGAQGMPKRGVPANATLLYDVKLIGVNGVNMCVA